MVHNTVIVLGQGSNMGEVSCDTTTTVTIASVRGQHNNNGSFLTTMFRHGTHRYTLIPI